MSIVRREARQPNLFFLDHINLDTSYTGALKSPIYEMKCMLFYKKNMWSKSNVYHEIFIFILKNHK